MKRKNVWNLSIVGFGREKSHQLPLKERVMNEWTFVVIPRELSTFSIRRLILLIKIISVSIYVPEKIQQHKKPEFYVTTSPTIGTQRSRRRTSQHRKFDNKFLPDKITRSCKEI